MSQSPEEIRAEIERTQTALGRDVDALADRTSPSRVVHRQTARAKDRLRHAKESVMGSAGDAAGSARHAAHDAGAGARGALHDAGSAVHDAPHQLAGQTRGNPLAAGVIAFGAGLLAAGLLPPTQKEREAAERLKEQAEPLTEEAKEVGRQVAEDLKEPAREAAGSVRDSASGAAEHVRDDARSHADDVRGSAQDAATEVKDSRSS